MVFVTMLYTVEKEVIYNENPKILENQNLAIENRAMY